MRNNKIKTIFNIIAIALLITTFVFALISLINYYNYASALNLIKKTQNPIEMIELQKNKIYFYDKILTNTIWTSYITFTTAIFNIFNFFYQKQKKEQSNKRIK